MFDRKKWLQSEKGKTSQKISEIKYKKSKKGKISQYKYNNSKKGKETKQKIYENYIKIMDQLKENGCSICGYYKCKNALEFHHINSKNKKFRITTNTISRNDLIEELNKCVLLCANCHREIEWSN
jgi:predicted transcriptional regulator